MCHPKLVLKSSCCSWLLLVLFFQGHRLKVAMESLLFCLSWKIQLGELLKTKQLLRPGAKVGQVGGALEWRVWQKFCGMCHYCLKYFCFLNSFNSYSIFANWSQWLYIFVGDGRCKYLVTWQYCWDYQVEAVFPFTWNYLTCWKFWWFDTLPGFFWFWSN